MRRFLALSALLASLLAPGWSQSRTQVPSQPAAPFTTPPPDTLAPGNSQPSPGVTAGPASQQVPADTSRPKSRADTVLVAKHRFNHREQLITGSVVMTCLAMMMVIMNNYNPR